jgi:hypothetical protein
MGGLAIAEQGASPPHGFAKSRCLPPFMQVHPAKTSGRPDMEVTQTPNFELFHATKLRLLSWYGWDLREKFC